MATVNEEVVSRKTTIDGTATSHSRRYNVTEATSDDDALTTLVAAMPATIAKNGILLTNRRIEMSELAEDTTFMATVTWRHQDNRENPPEELDVNDEEFSIDIAGQEVTITEAIAQQSQPAGAPDVGTRIHDNGEKVDGVPVLLPSTSYQRTKKLSAATVDAAWVKDKAQYVGSINDATFDGFAAGELLLSGISARRQGSSDDWIVTYTFHVSRNVANFSLAGETFTSKEGWDYAWVRYAPGEDATNKALKGDVQGVYLAQVYEKKDFTQLGL